MVLRDDRGGRELGGEEPEGGRLCPHGAENDGHREAGEGPQPGQLVPVRPLAHVRLEEEGRYEDGRGHEQERPDR